ncbi:MAG TPA: hypothetical protein VEM32_06505, partial [Geobacteraceae bacterium]|nr:hypothetical protein [Geobacteraceae bacterium]
VNLALSLKTEPLQTANPLTRRPRCAKGLASGGGKYGRQTRKFFLLHDRIGVVSLKEQMTDNDPAETVTKKLLGGTIRCVNNG